MGEIRTERGGRVYLERIREKRERERGLGNRRVIYEEKKARGWRKEGQRMRRREIDREK